MKLTLIGKTGCGNGPCPAVYATENDTIVVQGFTITSATSGIELPPGEGMVEIPRYVLEQVFSK